MQRRTNPFAIVAIIVVWFGSVLGLIFGYIALSQIKKTGDDGRGLALAAVIIGWIYLALGIIAVIFIGVVYGFAASTGSITTN